MMSLKDDNLVRRSVDRGFSGAVLTALLGALLYVSPLGAQTAPLAPEAQPAAAPAPEAVPALSPRPRRRDGCGAPAEVAVPRPRA